MTLIGLKELWRPPPHAVALRSGETQKLRHHDEATGPRQGLVSIQLNMRRHENGLPGCSHKTSVAGKPYHSPPPGHATFQAWHEYEEACIFRHNDNWSCSWLSEKTPAAGEEPSATGSYHSTKKRWAPRKLHRSQSVAESICRAH